MAVSLSSIIQKSTIQGVQGPEGPVYIPLFGTTSPPNPIGIQNGTVYFQHEA
jgi:hypothetical protein